MYITEFKGKYAFLSNFYDYPFDYGNLIWPTAEHAFQAQKTLHIYEMENILNMKSPALAKKYGRTVRLRDDWDFYKFLIMYDILLFKFSPKNIDLHKLLMDTGGMYLIEGNKWHDNTWGDCKCNKCDNIKGNNMLGKTLMHVRAFYRVMYLSEQRPNPNIEPPKYDVVTDMG